MIKFKFINIFLIIFLHSSNLFSFTISKEIVEKYDNIFDKKILSNIDVKNYHNIIEYQENCEWKLANKFIFKIKNRILIGHILAQRYLHPRCYRSEFLELKSWLELYNDLPQAKRIYRLAIKRMPKGYKRPKPPIKPIGVEASNLNPVKKKTYNSSLKLSKNQRTEKRKLLNAIKSRVNRGWPTGAAELLKQRDVNILLDQTEIDMQKELIAKGYYLANKNELAIKFADESLKNSYIHVPYASWTAGLAAWRLKRYDLSAKYFSNFSILLTDDEWHQASGSFWAARSYAQLNKFDEINFWLKKAANNPTSFYGMLSSNILGINKPINWNEKNIKSKIFDKIKNLPSGKRIQALIQIGLIEEIEKEIIKLNNTLNRDIALWSLEISNHFNLAYTQLKITNKLSQYGISVPTKYLYPIPQWKPKSGFKINSSLIYAFMHQESMFNSSAKSAKGALGLMQILPSTAKFISSDRSVRRDPQVKLKVPEVNLDVGQEYIIYLLENENVKNNLIYLAAAYNGGPGNLSKWKNKTNFNNDPLLFMESIPSRETRWFIEKIITKYWIYENRNGITTKSLELLAKGMNPDY